MKKLALCIACICLFCILPVTLSAQSTPGTSQTGRTEIDATRETTRVPFVNLNIREPQNNREVAFSIQLLLLITLITLAPSILLLMTSFLRLSIALDFIKRALSLQQVPPTQVLNGIALFLTIFIHAGKRHTEPDMRRIMRHLLIHKKAQRFFRFGIGGFDIDLPVRHRLKGLIVYVRKRRPHDKNR